MKSIKSNNKDLGRIARWCLDEVLKVKSYNIKIKCNLFLDVRGEFDERKKLIRINTFDRRKHSIIKTLFHELRHFYQFKTGTFQRFLYATDQKTAEWYFKTTQKPPPISKKAYQRFYRRYKTLPWEKDARDFSNKTYKRFLKHESNIH